MEGHAWEQRQGHCKCPQHTEGTAACPTRLSLRWHALAEGEGGREGTKAPTQGGMVVAAEGLALQRLVAPTGASCVVSRVVLTWVPSWLLQAVVEWSVSRPGSQSLPL